ncbi:aldehyde dehydrogenase family protein [Clostridium sp. AF18-27]|uniref:aldehyde dehydrogenase family protein n=1 Tax=Enterocloster lavalensis TaxID=460384 RepID=UPI000E51CC81|nr:aldehyde dehydrogenase family protein [Enterocloster lavalensis]MCB6343952.1 aldehyde dehydrogenase family protein [Enterocloster lavalensis]RHR49099.1 aldehyde dehydrogenase family protein [Clostridium sp. AF18-27]
MNQQTPEYVEAYIAKLVEKARVAQKYVEANYTDQKSVDELVRVAGKAIYDNAVALGQEAVAETGMGDLMGKVGKMKILSLRHWNFMKGRPSVGVIDDFSEPGVRVIAKPIGVLGSVTPSTNPVATIIGNAMMAFKTRNAIIIAPHPASAKGAVHTTQIIRDALETIGAPADLIQCIGEPSIAMTNELLKQADVNIATGGAGMVKAVYSSGKPAYGVGQGNCQAIVDEDYDNFERAAATIVANRAFDQGVPCTGEQTMHVPAGREEEMKAALRKAGAFIIEDQSVIDHIREIVFPGPMINRAVVGKNVQQLGEIFGLKVPAEAKVICFKVQAKGAEDILCKEILCPILRYTTYEKFEDAVDTAITNLENEGAGHSSSIWSKNEDRILYVANLIPVGRFHIEQPTMGSANNAIAPTVTIGCGSWGNNSISENLQYYHLMNVTRVSTELPDPIIHAEEDWDVYEMRSEWGQKVRY